MQSEVLSGMAVEATAGLCGTVTTRDVELKGDWRSMHSLAQTAVCNPSLGPQVQCVE